MPKLTLIELCFWLYVAQNVVSGDLYHKVGGELVLKPDKSTVTDHITSIIWKHGKYKVAEWDNDFGGLDIYGAFKERTTLDQTTGELRISGLMTTDSGVYSVEFNSKLLVKTYKLTVIKAVPKPTITSSCNPDKTSCILTCEGNTTDAEPVTYSWKVGDGPWKGLLDKQKNVSKSDTGKSTNSYKYICKLNNTFSVEVSEPVGELFGSEPSNTGAIVVVFIIVALVAIVITGFLLWKKKTGYPQNTWIYFLRKYFGGMFAKGSAGVQPEQGKGNADKAEKGKGNEDDHSLEVGGELVLKPDKYTVPDSITTILWKHGKCWVAYWDKDSSGRDIYGAFKGRTTLDQNTGELRISGLKKSDSGVYSVEFNSKLLDKTYKLSVINKPSGSNRPKDESKPDAKGSDGVQPEQETVLLTAITKTVEDDADKAGKGQGNEEASPLME